MYKSLGQGLPLTDHSIDMSSTQHNKDDGKRMIRSRFTYIEWEEEEKSTADLWESSKKFKDHVEDHNEHLRFLELNHKLESDIPGLEETKVRSWLNEMYRTLCSDIMLVEGIIDRIPGFF
jgi:hypothetical protein